MTTDQLESLHLRLDTLADKLDTLHAAQAAQCAVCEGARAKVDRLERVLLGNGREGLLTRIERLETISAVRGRGFWATVALLSAIVSGLVVTLGQSLVDRLTSAP